MNFDAVKNETNNEQDALSKKTSGINLDKVVTSDYSEGRTMDPESKAQLDARNEINNGFLERNGSGDYRALDEYLSKYDNAPDYSEGRTMDPESKAQLDARNEINNGFLERNGS